MFGFYLYNVLFCFYLFSLSTVFNVTSFMFDHLHVRVGRCLCFILIVLDNDYFVLFHDYYCYCCYLFWLFVVLLFIILYTFYFLCALFLSCCVILFSYVHISSFLLFVIVLFICFRCFLCSMFHLLYLYFDQKNKHGKTIIMIMINGFTVGHHLAPSILFE